MTAVVALAATKRLRTTWVQLWPWLPSIALGQRDRHGGSSKPPNGNLYTARDVARRLTDGPNTEPIAHAPVEAHSHMGKGTTYLPRHASIAAQQAGIPILATLKELVHAIHELPVIFIKSEQRIRATKSAILEELLAERIKKQKEADISKRRIFIAVQ